MKKLAVIFLIFSICDFYWAEPENSGDIPGLPEIPVSQQPIFPPAQSPSQYSSLCLGNDIVGFWKVIKWTPYFHIPAKDWNKPAFMKFQWYIFSADGKIKCLSAQKEFKITEVEKKLNDSKTPLHFDFENKGIMKITSIENKEVNELWRCAIVTKDINEKKHDIELRRGDLLLSLLGKNNKILYVRQLRKINQLEKEK